MKSSEITIEVCWILPSLLFAIQSIFTFCGAIEILSEINTYFLPELFCGTKIFIKGDKIPRDESALIIMNHRCRLDWMFYFMVLLRNGRLDHEKIILRDDLKLVPGPGNSRT